jgi:hypothetical protein
MSAVRTFQFMPGNEQKPASAGCVTLQAIQPVLCFRLGAGLNQEVLAEWPSVGRV